jgi:hypothetical protein
MATGWNLIFFQKHRFHIFHFPNSTGLFTKPTGRHYAKYRFSPDIELRPDAMSAVPPALREELKVYGP